MGLFSSKYVINVASSLYNLAGPEEDRPDFLKSTIFSAVISDNNTYLGESVVGNHLNGPGIKQRQFFRWAVNSSFSGLPSVSIRRAADVDPAVVGGQIPVPATPAGLQLQLQNAQITDADFTIFAERWILENRPDDITDDWIADVSEGSNVISISFTNGDVEYFTEPDFDLDARYVTAKHYFTKPDEVDPVVVGTLNEDVPFPDVSAYTLDSVANTSQVEDFTLNITTTVDVTYSDATPDEQTVTPGTEDVSVTEQLHTYTRRTYIGEGVVIDQTDWTFLIYENRKVDTGRNDVTVVVEDIGGGVTKTTTTTITGEQLVPKYDTRLDSQLTVKGEVSGGMKFFIYKLGSGNVVLDALDEDVSATGFEEFFPFIPVRINNVSITDDQYVSSEGGNGLYEESRKAYRRASGGKSFSQIIDIVEDNENLDDIDYAYQCYGVALNVKDNSCRKYAYNFLKELIQFQTTTVSAFDAFKVKVANYETQLNTFNSWQGSVQGGEGGSGEYVGDPPPPPPVPVGGLPPTTTLKLKTENPLTASFDNRITWINITESLHTGVFQVDGEDVDEDTVHFVKGEDFVWTERVGYRERGDIYYQNEERRIQNIEVVWQTSDNSYKKLTCYGMVHQNYIYGGKAVTISAHQALDDEDTSGFLLPMHYPTVREMSLIDSTQMATANTFILFNSYQVTKVKWYQRGIFKLFLILVVVVISVVTGGAGAAGAGGILGTNAAVGAALGLSGTAALIVGAVANALAAMIVTQVISRAAVAVFGDKLGAIIGALVSFFTLSAFQSGGFNFDWSSLTTAQGVLQFTNALANGYSGWVQANIAEIRTEMAQNQERYDEQMEKINELIRELGGNNLNFNPMQLTDVDENTSSQGNYLPETLDEFIHRTTMTGSEIADVTLSMVTDYTTLSLTLPKN